MIEGMVSKLATRLASTGGGVDEWSRLIRAYTVLHEADKAEAALASARKALAPDPNAVASLDALAHDLGLGDAAAIPEAQRPMIEGMVSKLATRLASNGGGVDEWSRLIRAYTVLHEDGKAKAALVRRPQGARIRRQRGREPRCTCARPWPGRRQLTRRGRRLALIAAALAVVGVSGWTFALRAERQHRLLLQPL